ncbi:MAG TPA: hypothetical protein ENJ38_02510 [Rhodospirillales bacterium]|nr:hypothetical protein [Rhodospirillales bacterium]
MADSMARGSGGGMVEITIRVLVALALLGLLLWVVWGMKDRPLATRPLTLEKGRYVGPVERPLGEGQVERTRQRARFERF